jgi:hypothetical protein
MTTPETIGIVRAGLAGTSAAKALPNSASRAGSSSSATSLNGPTTAHRYLTPTSPGPPPAKTSTCTRSPRTTRTPSSWDSGRRLLRGIARNAMSSCATGRYRRKTSCW